jgi:salicylate hydroxylase
MNSKDQTILIAGAGIGGFTAALALRRQGFTNVQVIEQAPQLGEVGAGVQLAPNASKALHKLGLADDLAQHAVRPRFSVARSWNSGRLIRRFPLGDDCLKEYGSPYFHIHRAHLHAALSKAFGDKNVHLSQKIRGFNQDAGGVTVHTESGAQFKGSVLIAADGVHSVIRTELTGGEKPIFQELVAWRGLAPVDQIHAPGEIERNTHSYWGPHRHFVHYYVAGGKLMNWIGVVPAKDWREESWSKRGDKAEIEAEFAGWHPNVQAIIRATPAPYKWALYDREPLPNWTYGRVTLLGDAAHAMLPFMSQGAAQSIEDGYVLGLCLAENPSDPQAALQKYEALRIPRTRAVQLGSRANGKLFHETSFWGRIKRDVEFFISSVTKHGSRRKTVDWVYRYDVDHVLNA